MNKLKKLTWFDYLLVLIFLLVLLMTFYPFLNVLAISLNDSLETIKNINIIVPSKWTLSNYRYVFQDKDLINAALLSVARTVIGAFLSVIATSMLAYALARKDFIARKLFTVIFVITMYVGGGIIPDYLLIVQTLGLKNNFLVYLLPGLIWVYNMILIRSYIQGLPDALEEAAMLDGCTQAQVSRYIIIPYIRPILRVSVIFAITGSLKSFDLIYVLTNGGPNHATEVPSTLMISMLFLRNRYGMGSTIAVMLIILCFAFALLINVIFKEEK